jgi:hypothetical protein
MAKKPKDDKPKPAKAAKLRTSRDFSQRAHDVVREVELRHAERHKDD